MKGILVLVTGLALIQRGHSYPGCLLIRGECLDGSKGPLEMDVKPQINHNVIKVVSDVNLDECAKHCHDEGACRC